MVIKKYEVLCITTFDELFEILGPPSSFHTKYTNDDFNDMDIQLVIETGCFSISGNDQKFIDLDMDTSNVDGLIDHAFAKLGIDVHQT